MSGNGHYPQTRVFNGVHRSLYIDVWIFPSTWGNYCHYICFQESGNTKTLEFETARKSLSSAINREECLKYEMHHLVKCSLLQDSELSHLLDAGTETRYNDKLLQSLLKEATSL